jgi:steroid delta-isomerase-like uncharacterized protein
MSSENAAIVRRWFDEVWNQRREETIDDLLTDDSVCYGEDGALVGVSEFRDRRYRPMVAAFPDLRVQIDDVIADGERVAIRWSASGTHTSDGLGFGPTGQAVTFSGLTWMRLGGGKIIEGWQSSNIPEILLRLATPPV